MDAMVTARMPQGKKEAANLILRNLGTNPSQFINDVYDYVILNKKLPLENARPFLSAEGLQEAIAFVDSIPLRNAGRFAHMSDDEIKQERLIARGLATESSFE